jgi:hypothetical protein
VGYQTLWNKVLRGIKPCGTRFKNEYFCEFEKEFKNILGCEFGDYMGRFEEKTRGKKSRATVPLNLTYYCLQRDVNSLLPLVPWIFLKSSSLPKSPWHPLATIAGRLSHK